MKLIELIRICDQDYFTDFRESSLLALVNPREGTPLLKLDSPIGDTLALFMVRALTETFNSNASDEQQLEKAIWVLEEARNNIQHVICALRKLGCNHQT